MRLVRDMDAPELIKGLQRIGYGVVWQTGSHDAVAHKENGGS